MINKTEVMTYAKEVLGNNAKGLFVDIGVVEEYGDPLDYEVMTNLEEKIPWLQSYYTNSTDTVLGPK